VREALASELRKAYWESRTDLDSWHKSDNEAKQAWRRVADVAISMIGAPVANARLDNVRKGHEMRHALWTIIEEAQAALKVD
jgi:DNA polymerase III psi subunit